MPFHFDDIESYSDDGLAAIKIRDKWGFMNTKGIIIVPPKYIIAPFASLTFLKKYLGVGYIRGIARVKYKGKWGYLNTKGELLGDKWYENAENFVNITE